MRQYVAQCIGILEGYIAACFEMAPLLTNAWLENDTQRRVAESLKNELRMKTAAEDAAFDEVAAEDVIRAAALSKTIVEIRYTVACNTAQLCKRALEDYQRIMNDTHLEMKKLLADVKQIAGDHGAHLTIKMNDCIHETSPLQIIAKLCD